MATTDSEKAYLTLLEDFEQSKKTLKEEKENLVTRLQEIEDSLIELDKQSKLLDRKFNSFKKREEEFHELIRSFDLAPKKRKRKTKKTGTTTTTSEPNFPSEPILEEEESAAELDSSFESEY